MTIFFVVIFLRNQKRYILKKIGDQVQYVHIRAKKKKPNINKKIIAKVEHQHYNVFDDDFLCCNFLKKPKKIYSSKDRRSS
jgi:hypothetical protein